MLDAEIPALQMLLVSDDVCVAWFRGKLTSFFIRKKKGGGKVSARVFQPFANAAFWGPVTVRA